MNTPNQILENLSWRYAVKQFDSTKKLTDDEKHLIKETLRLAPSSFGMQLWHFYFVESSELRAKIKEKAWNQSQVIDASELVVLCRPTDIKEEDVDKLISKTSEERGMPVETLDGYSKVIKGFMTQFDAAKKASWMDRQVYVALGTLLTACAFAGIDACPMEGFEPDGVDEILGLKEKGLASVVLCTIGHRSADDKYASLKKVRYSADQVVTTV